MRCLAIAKELSRLDWRVGIAAAEASRNICDGAKDAVDRIIYLPDDDANSPQALGHAVGGHCRLAVVDHYGLDAEYERCLEPWTDMQMAIDDLVDRQHACGILLDPTPGGRPDDVGGPAEASARRLLGAGYAPIRRPIARRRPASLARKIGPERNPGQAKRILISCGFTDPTNLTGMALAAVAATLPDGVRLDVVLGGQAPHIDAVRAAMTPLGDRARLHIAPDDMAGLLAEADIAIGAGGGSALERCCLGLPSVALSAADNQSRILAGLSAAGAIVAVDGRRPEASADIADAVDGLLTDSGRRRRMSIAAARTCDGLGAARVALAVAPEIAKNGRAVGIRTAGEDDMELLFRWQTAPGARRFSGTPRPPTWEEHSAWMDRRLAPQGGLFEILTLGCGDAGVLRLDGPGGTGGRYTVSILVAPEFQGLGIGKAALRIARRLLPDDEFIAVIHDDNAPSIRIFRSVGYTRDGDHYISRPGS